jgi:hypothetical protein
MLSDNEKSFALKDFPKNIELSYERNDHKKVYPDFYLAIPEGKRGFMWFTEYRNQNVCFFLEIGQKNQIYDLKIIRTSFKDSLCYGTVFYGTYMQHKKRLVYFTEDIFYYKGKYISGQSFSQKLGLFNRIYSRLELGQTLYMDSQVIFGMPVISTDVSKLNKFVSDSVSYPIKHILERTDKGKYISYFKPQVNDVVQEQNTVMSHNKQQHQQYQRERVFEVKPDIQNDIYYLYNEGKLLETAFIPDYKTSVMMNRLFRNIKENEDLDKLEESDDEEEFEDEREDKFVFLDKTYKMVCQYNNKFKKWTPIRLAK